MLPTFGFFELPAINIIFDRFQVHKSSMGVYSGVHKLCRSGTFIRLLFNFSCRRTCVRYCTYVMFTY